jgi:TRAP-type mannitol/chloroaromatic compound transport system permease small subunit
VTSYSPQPLNYEEERRRAAAGRDYTTPAVITLLLYLLFWLPGLIANIVYWQSASRDQRIIGRQPDGKGCLVALFVVFTVLPVVGLVVLFGCSALGLLGAGLGSR